MINLVISQKRWLITCSAPRGTWGRLIRWPDRHRVFGSAPSSLRQKRSNMSQLHLRSRSAFEVTSIYVRTKVTASPAACPWDAPKRYPTNRLADSNCPEKRGNSLFLGIHRVNPPHAILLVCYHFRTLC